MKKYIFILLSIWLSDIALAQISTPSGDSIKNTHLRYGTDVNLHLQVKNNSTSVDTFYFQVRSVNVPNGWSFNVCDATATCSPDFTNGQSSAKYLTGPKAAGHIEDFKGKYTLTSTADSGVGVSVVRSWVGTSDTDLIYIGITDGPTSIKKLNVDDKFFIYYDRGADQLIVTTKSGVDAAKMEVFNVLGSRISVNNLENQISRFNLNCPKGQYFVRLYERDGSFLGVRKFIKTSDN